MDGATLIDQRGGILAGGAILRVPGGGRTAAARAINEYGVGIPGWPPSRPSSARTDRCLSTSSWDETQSASER